MGFASPRAGARSDGASGGTLHLALELRAPENFPGAEKRQIGGNDMNQWRRRHRTQWLTRTTGIRVAAIVAVVLFTWLVGLVSPASAAVNRSNATSASPPGAPPGYSASPTLSGITGTVYDARPLQGPNAASVVIPTGLSVVGGAHVDIPALHVSTTSDSAGHFTIGGVPTRVPYDRYNLIVTAPGFGAWTMNGTVVPANTFSVVSVFLGKNQTTLSDPAPGAPAHSSATTSQAGTLQSSPTFSSCSGEASNSVPPKVIKVFFTGQYNGVSGAGPGGQTQGFDFQYYVEHVLPFEWPNPSPTAAYQAGAIAIADYAWYYVNSGSKGAPSSLYPVPSACSFSVDDYSGDYQKFLPYASTTYATDSAVLTSANYVFQQGGAIQQTSFRAGYSGMPCNYGAGTNTMYQYGTVSCANDGLNFEQIVENYFTNGTFEADPAYTDMVATPSSNGYWITSAEGGVFTFGNAGFYGSLPSLGVQPAAPIVDMASTPSGGGYWLVGADGGVYAFGNAGYYGSEGGQKLNAPIVALVPTPDGGGYWLVGADGGIFTFGDAGFYGSMGGKTLSGQIEGMASTPSGGGYWLVGSDGGIFAFGNAGYYGSMGGQTLNAPIIDMARTSDGGGYWLVGSDGGIFAFGDAGFYGSMGGQTLSAPIVGIAPDYATGGYWELGGDGGVFAFQAPLYGSE